MRFAAGYGFYHTFNYYPNELQMRYPSRQNDKCQKTKSKHLRNFKVDQTGLKDQST